MNRNEAPQRAASRPNSPTQGAGRAQVEAVISVFRCALRGLWRRKRARPRRGQPRKGRPAALAASPCPQRAALRERGEGAKRLRGVFHFSTPSSCSSAVLRGRPPA
jgi:hypothetical protein